MTEEGRASKIALISPFFQLLSIHISMFEWVPYSSYYLHLFVLANEIAEKSTIVYLYIALLYLDVKKQSYRGEAPMLGITQASLLLPSLKRCFQDFGCFTRQTGVQRLKSMNSLRYDDEAPSFGILQASLMLLSLKRCFQTA